MILGKSPNSARRELLGMGVSQERTPRPAASFARLRPSRGSFKRAGALELAKELASACRLLATEIYFI